MKDFEVGTCIEFTQPLCQQPFKGVVLRVVADGKYWVSCPYHKATFIVYTDDIVQVLTADDAADLLGQEHQGISSDRQGHSLNLYSCSPSEGITISELDTRNVRDSDLAALNRKFEA